MQKKKVEVKPFTEVEYQGQVWKIETISHPSHGIMCLIKRNNGTKWVYAHELKVVTND